MGRAGSEAWLPELGVGVNYSSALAPLLAERPGLVDVVEVEPQTVWLKTRGGPEPYQFPEQVLEHLTGLPGRKLVHSVGAPVGGAVRPDASQFPLLRRTVERLGAPWASEHLSFNTTPDFHTGFFLPPRQTPEGAETAATAVRALRRALPVPLAVETGVNYLRPRADEMADGDFIAAVVGAADCGLLLDLHNLYANELNGRQPVEDCLARLPLERVWEVHLAGGMEMDGYWLDAHSGAVPEPLFQLARRVVPYLPNLKAIIFEIFPAFVPVAGFAQIGAQVERLRELWEMRRTKRETAPPFVRLGGRAAAAAGGATVPPAEWERALGSLVIGRPPGEADALARELSGDAGVGVISRLVNEFRASMVVGALRLTSRLLMLALGPDVFRALLEDFWSKTPPQQYASAEAANFADYLEALDLRVPRLAKLLEFERAVIATLEDGRARLVAFDFDPVPTLRGLAEGRLTESDPGSYEIEITPDAPPLADPDAVNPAFPFH